MSAVVRLLPVAFMAAAARHPTKKKTHEEVLVRETCPPMTNAVDRHPPSGEGEGGGGVHPHLSVVVRLLPVAFMAAAAAAAMTPNEEEDARGGLVRREA